MARPYISKTRRTVTKPEATNETEANREAFFESLIFWQ